VFQLAKRSPAHAPRVSRGTASTVQARSEFAIFFQRGGPVDDQGDWLFDGLLHGRSNKETAVFEEYAVY